MITMTVTIFTWNEDEEDDRDSFVNSDFDEDRWDDDHEEDDESDESDR